MSMNDINHILESAHYALFKNTYCSRNLHCTNSFIKQFNFIADSLLNYYSDICKNYDEAPDYCCFEKRYKIQESSFFLEELRILTTVSDVIQKFELQYVSFIKYIIVLGRFMFANNHMLRLSKSEFPDLCKTLLRNSLSILYKGSWPFKDTVLVKLFVLNLLDSLIENKEDIKTIINSLTLDTQNPVTYEIMNSTIESYLLKSTNNNLSVTPISKDWLYAIIYKNRFGYIYCKDFSLENNEHSFYSMKSFSLSNKSLKPRIVYSPSKVILFEAGNMKRSSNYVPTEDSSFFNIATLRFE